jgi:hypothetical protein
LQVNRPDAFERPRRCKSYLIMGTIVFSLAVASFGAFQFVRHFVLCFGISCLKPQIVGVDNRSITYAFRGGYCFMTSKILYPTQYEHMRHKWAISAVLQIAYLIYPTERLFIIRSTTDVGPIIAIHNRNLANRNTDIEFCSEEVRATNSEVGFSLQQAPDTKGRQR